MQESNKLFRVVLRGMTTTMTGVAYGISYVIAKNMDEAYRKVREFLDDQDIGFRKDREVEKVELLAEDYQYTGTGTMLFL
jgi:hypothetical protein